MADDAGTGVVQVAYLHNEHVSHSWVESMRRMFEYDLTHGGRLAREPMNLRCGAGMVAHVRNYGARLFIDKTPHEWLLYVDTDMGFEPDAVHRLLAVADPADRPVVGALCFADMVDGYDGMGGYRRTIVPTMYKIGHTNETGQPSFCYFGDYVDDTVTPVAATGGAFLLIHRSALEKLRAEWGNHWFTIIHDSDGDIVGEDIAFCGRLLKAGIIPCVHTGVKTTHHKERWLSELDYQAQKALTVTLPAAPEQLPVFIDLDASFAALGRFEHDHDGMLKFDQDLDRYRQIIGVTRPDVIVETGTRAGGSARWFADQGVNVITVDTNPLLIGQEYRNRVQQVVGNSVDPTTVAQVQELLRELSDDLILAQHGGPLRVMVSLDSDHSGPHVTREIEAYGPLVTPGCYLVVEDGIFGYGVSARVQQGLADMEGSPLDAIAECLLDMPGWSRDVALERMHPVSSNPAGWWVRHG